MNIINFLWVYKKKFFRFKQSKRMEIYKTWMDKKSITFKSLLWSELFISIPSYFVCGKITSRGRNWWERFLCSIYIFPHTFLDLVKFPDKILMSIHKNCYNFLKIHLLTLDEKMFIYKTKIIPLLWRPWQPLPPWPSPSEAELANAHPFWKQEKNISVKLISKRMRIRITWALSAVCGGWALH